ncbi:MAG TPA: molybdate ABC transporter substrate-binding protein [Vicinamibacterales bacterium]
MRFLGCFVVLAIALRAPAPPASLIVSAATSLTDALDDVAKAYGAAGGGEVRFNFAGSNVLARQIVNGAPADLFISADETQMEVVQKAGLIVAGSRVDLVGNQLAVVASPERASRVRDRFANAPAEIRRLAIGDPAAVPAGVYARRYLEAQGLWKAYEPRVVPTANVRAALVAVETGGADAAIVYATDLAAARTATIAFLVPPDIGPRIVYPAALLSSSSNQAEARRFLSFLIGRDAAAIFARHKFIPLASR